VLHQIKLTYGRRLLRRHQHPASGGAAAITFFITAARDRLPVLVEGARLLPASTVVNAALLFLPFAALIALALRRPRSILDVWLAVTMFTKWGKQG
jgi:hypothetical protein